VMKGNPMGKSYDKDSDSARLRNPTQGGHGFRRKADSIPMIADSG
jgi:hypothetical protein